MKRARRKELKDAVDALKLPRKIARILFNISVEIESAHEEVEFQLKSLLKADGVERVIRNYGCPWCTGDGAHKSTCRYAAVRPHL